MRVILIILIVILIALLGLPYWFGIQTEKDYKNITKDYSESEHLEITDQSYQKGWLNSKAKTTFLLINGDSGILKLEEIDTIYHGPIPLQLLFGEQAVLRPVMAVIDSEVRVIPVKESDYSEIIKNIPPLELFTTLSLDGHGTTQITMRGLNTESGKQGEKLVWNGLEGVIDFGPQLESLDTRLKSPGLEIDGKDTELSITDIEGESNLIYKDKGHNYPTGEASVSVKELFVKSTDDETGEEDYVRINGIRISGSTEEETGTLSSAHSAGFEEIEIAGRKYGPGGYDLAIRNIDIASWRKIQKLINENERTRDTEQSKEQFMTELTLILPDLVRKSPEIELTKLSIETDKGVLQGYALISVDGSNLENPELAANPLFLITSIKASAELSISKTLLKSMLTDYEMDEISDDYKNLGNPMPSANELEEMAEKAAEEKIKELLNKNFIVIEGESYELRASYEMGQVMLNGSPLGLDSFMKQ
ncbi:MAG: YdgA family protein [Deltaproteobacteria bacterium]